ncbi:MAG: hypothetical protein ACE5G5_01815 [Candidatus Methylomirabilales bacterium]
MRRSVGTVVFGLIIAVAALLATGCNVQVRMGKRPDLRALEDSLVIGESTAADVSAVLGQPQGVGRSMLPIASKPRTMWFYHYAEGTLENGRQVFVFVYFDKDRYDGYMWFSSLPD